MATTVYNVFSGPGMYESWHRTEAAARKAADRCARRTKRACEVIATLEHTTDAQRGTICYRVREKWGPGSLYLAREVVR